MTIVAINITEKQKVRDYVEYNKRPFTIKDVEESTGVVHKTIEAYLTEMRKKGTIKKIMTNKRMNVYIQNRKRREESNWNPNKNKLKEILHVCNRITATEIATILMISRTTVENYLNVLYVEGYIRIIDKVASKARLYEQIKEMGKDSARCNTVPALQEKPTTNTTPPRFIGTPLYRGEFKKETRHALSLRDYRERAREMRHQMIRVERR